MCDLDSTTSCQVAIKVEFFLQFESLVTSVRRPLSLRLTILIYRVWKLELKIKLESYESVKLFLWDYYQISAIWAIDFENYWDYQNKTN